MQFVGLPADFLAILSSSEPDNITTEFGNSTKITISGLNGVAVARHGPILGGSGATGSRKLSRYLPDLREAIFDKKIKKCRKN